MKKSVRKLDYGIIQKREKLIANLIRRGYYLRDIYHHLQRSENLNTSLFNFYKIVRSGRYELINSALKTKKGENEKN